MSTKKRITAREAKKYIKRCAAMMLEDAFEIGPDWLKEDYRNSYEPVPFDKIEQKRLVEALLEVVAELER